MAVESELNVADSRIFPLFKFVVVTLCVCARACVCVCVCVCVRVWLGRWGKGKEKHEWEGFLPGKRGRMRNICIYPLWETSADSSCRRCKEQKVGGLTMFIIQRPMFVILQSGIRVLWRAADEAERRPQQLARLWDGLPRLPHDEEAGLLTATCLAFFTANPVMKVHAWMGSGLAPCVCMYVSIYVCMYRWLTACWKPVTCVCVCVCVHLFNPQGFLLDTQCDECKLCMLVVLIEFYPLVAVCDLDLISRSQGCQKCKNCKLHFVIWPRLVCFLLLLFLFCFYFIFFWVHGWEKREYKEGGVWVYACVCVCMCVWKEDVWGRKGQKKSGSGRVLAGLCCRVGVAVREIATALRSFVDHGFVNHFSYGASERERERGGSVYNV